MEKYLNIDHISIEFPTPNGPFKALDDVSLKIDKGEFVSILRSTRFPITAR